MQAVRSPSLPSSPIPSGLWTVGATSLPAWHRRIQFLGYSAIGWHEADCERSDHLPSVTKLCSWVLLELHLHQPDAFPALLDSLKVHMDPSLTSLGGQIVGFVCTDSKDFEDSSRHYWFVELEDGQLRYAIL